jgi:hypothetical protein
VYKGSFPAHSPAFVVACFFDDCHSDWSENGIKSLFQRDICIPVSIEVLLKNRDNTETYIFIDQ